MCFDLFWPFHHKRLSCPSTSCPDCTARRKRTCICRPQFVQPEISHICITMGRGIAKTVSAKCDDPIHICIILSYIKGNITISLIISNIFKYVSIHLNISIADQIFRFCRIHTMRLKINLFSLFHFNHIFGFFNFFSFFSFFDYPAFFFLICT